jgi:hypothetical protein
LYHFLSHGRAYPEWWPVLRDAQSDAYEVTVGARVRYHVKALRKRSPAPLRRCSGGRRACPVRREALYQRDGCEEPQPPRSSLHSRELNA